MSKKHFARFDRSLKKEIKKRGYEILSPIGGGSQSCVFVAKALETNTKVIVKQLRVSQIQEWENQEAFLRESEILKTLNHPNIPSMVSSFTIKKDSNIGFFSIQELMPGQALSSLLDEGRLITQEELITIAKGILDILIYLHSADPAILHRDIKPSNLLLSEKGKVSLIDFGATQYVQEGKTLAIGTQGYMALEQLRGSATPQSDLYSLGMTLVHLATGVDPEDLGLSFSLYLWRHLAALDEAFGNWIDKMIAPALSQRYKSATLAMAALEELSSLKTIPPLSAKKHELRIWQSDQGLTVTLQKQRNWTSRLTRFFRTSNRDAKIQFSENVGIWIQEGKVEYKTQGDQKARRCQLENISVDLKKANSGFYRMRSEK